MDIEQLRTFKTVAECGSFAKGSDQLYLTRSSVKRHIDALEGELGVALFDRTHQGVALTEAGRALLGGLDAIMPELDSLLDRVIHISTRHSIRIAFSSIVPVRSLSAVVSRYAQTHPEVSIELKPMSDARFVDSLSSGNADLCIWYATPEVIEAGLEVRSMQSFPQFSCYVAKGHPLAHRDSVSLDDLRGQQVMCRHEFLSEIVSALAARDISCANGAMSETWLPQIIRFVQDGGVHIMTRGFAELVGCVEIPLNPGQLHIAAGILHRPNPPDYLESFITLLAQA